MEMVLKLFCGTSNTALAQAIGRGLAHFTEFDSSVECVASEFNDGEPRVEITENLRGADVFIIQPTQQPGGNFVELLTMLDAACRADAREITAVVPYFGYARQDKKVKARTPITASMVSNLIFTMGARRILTTDLHAAQIQGFTSLPPRPFDNLEALPVLLRPVARDLGLTKKEQFQEIVLVAPDDGGVERCREAGKLVNCGLITFFMKGRDCDGNLISGGVIRDVELVRDRVCVIVDDLVATAKTLEQCAVALKEAGAREVLFVCLHTVLSPDEDTGMSACERLVRSPIDHCYFTDTIPYSEERVMQVNAKRHSDCPRDPERAVRFFRELDSRVTITSVAGLFAGAINEIHKHGSVSGIFRRTCAQIFED